MTTATATPGSVTSLLGQQGQTGSAQPQQLDPQGLFDIVVKALPVVLKTVTDLMQQSASPQQFGGFQPQQFGFTPQGFTPQGQQLDPQGLFDFVVKNLPVIVKTVTDVAGAVMRQSAQPPGLQPAQQQPGQFGQQQLDPQLFGALIPIIASAAPAIISGISSLLRPQGAGQPGFAPQSILPQQPSPYQYPYQQRPSMQMFN